MTRYFNEEQTEVHSENRMRIDLLREKQDRFVIPSDLSEWVNKDLLREWVIAEIDSLNWEHPELVAHLQKHPAYHPRQLFYLLTYAFVTSLFESEDVMLQANREPALRRMLKDYSP